MDYDGGIALHGFALGQGAEQMSSRQALELGRDRPLWMAMRWQIAPGLDVDYAISLRLHDAAGERVFQEDAVLWNPAIGPRASWPAHEPVETLDLIQFPADLPAGEYELRMVVYDFETLVPTVEIGVWEPEVTLARLRLAETSVMGGTSPPQIQPSVGYFCTDKTGSGLWESRICLKKRILCNVQSELASSHWMSVSASNWWQLRSLSRWPWQ